MKTSEEFILSQRETGYRNIERLDIKKERKDREYYLAQRQDGSMVFFKRIISIQTGIMPTVSKPR